MLNNICSPFSDESIRLTLLSLSDHEASTEYLRASSQDLAIARDRAESLEKEIQRSSDELAHEKAK